MKIRVRLIGLSKIMDGIQNIILCQPGNVKEPILKKVRLEKKFTPYPHFIAYDFEAILAPLNEHPTDDLKYLSRYIPISVAVHDALSKEPVYLVDKNPKRLIKRFIEDLTEKQEAMDADALKQHPFIEGFRKMAGQYYPDKIDVCKDAVSIPGISMTYVLSKSLEKKQKA